MKLLAILLLPIIATLAHAESQELSRSSDPQPAPDFQLEDTEGNTRTLADYRGKVMIVNFWATWCSPCVKEMPSLQRAWEQLREEDIQVLGINLGETPEAIARFTERYPVDFPVLLDRKITVAKAWDVKGLPVTYVVDAEGRLVYRVLGDKEWDDPALLKQVRALKQNL